MLVEDVVGGPVRPSMGVEDRIVSVVLLLLGLAGVVEESSMDGDTAGGFLAE